MERSFIIDSLPERALCYRYRYAVVAVDVIRATTTAITAVSMGRVCYPVDSLSRAHQLARTLRNPLLAGEIGGRMPAGFDVQNSPAEMARRNDISRPLILLSSSGTRLMLNASKCDRLFLACFRNVSSLARYFETESFRRIALIGAGSIGDFREEDQICCAWLGSQLSQAGYVPEDRETAAVLRRWQNASPADCLVSRSVEYLRKTGQVADLNFILNKIDDLQHVFVMCGGRVSILPTTRSQSKRERALFVKAVH